ncbi:MAG: acyltransferase domain-containing protein, partial [bacterium]
MSDQVVFLFSGQGSHYYQMGRELYERHPGFRKWMLMGDGLASDLIGLSVLEQLYNDPFRKSDRFDRTLYTHPAIFLVEYALARTVMDMGIEPTHVLDSSLGGFAAAAVAGVLSFEEALTAVVEQAKVLEAQRPKVMYISCSRAHILPSISQYYLWEVICEPVHFQKAIQLLESMASYTYL